jgi:hypothetical protein
MSSFEQKVNECATKFNRLLTFMADVYISKKMGSFDEDKAIRTKHRLRIISSTHPTWMITTCGPFFLKYAHLIKNEQWKELMKMDFAEEKHNYGKSEDGQNHDNKSMESKIKFIKRLWCATTGKEKNKLKETINQMLSAYCEYALAVKTNT